MEFVRFMRSFAGRALRLVAGSIIIWLALVRLEAPWSWLVAVIGLVPIIAAVFNLCLLAPLFHLDLQGRPKEAGSGR